MGIKEDLTELTDSSLDKPIARLKETGGGQIVKAKW